MHELPALRICDRYGVAALPHGHRHPLLHVGRRSSLIFAIVICITAFRGTLRCFRLPAIVPAVIFLAVSILAALDQPPTNGPAIMTLAALAYGAAYTCIEIAWLELIANQKLADIAIVFASAMLIKCVVPLPFALAPFWLIAAASGVFLAASIALLKMGRKAIAGDKTSIAHPPLDVAAYRHGFSHIADVIVVLVVLEAMVSVFNGFLYGITGAGNSAFASSIGGSVAAASFCFMALVVFKMSDIERLYRYLFPILLASVLLIPVISQTAPTLTTSGLVLGAFAFIYESVMYGVTFFILRQIRIEGLSTYLFAAAAIALLRLVQLVFGVTGFMLGGLPSDSSGVALFAASVLAIYALSLLLLYLTRHKQQPAKQAPTSEDDAFSLRAQELSERCGLTARESEILLQLARGRSASFIANTLVCSPATVRTHMKSIYTKLDVHSKQELIDLFSPDGR